MKRAGGQTSAQLVWRLAALLAPYRRDLALSILAGLATIAASAGLMATAAYLISAAALRPSIAELQVAIVLVRFFGLSRGIFRYLERLLTHSVNLGLLARLRTWLYEHLEPLAPAVSADYSIGDLLARLSPDINTLEAFYVRVASPVVIALVAATGATVLLYHFAPTSAGVLLMALLAIGLGLPLIMHELSASAARRLVELRAQVAACWVDAVQGAADLSSFGRAPNFIAETTAAVRELADNQRRLAWLEGASAGFTSFITNLGMLLVLALAIPLVREGALPGAWLAPVTLGALAIFEAVLPLPLAAQALEASLQAARRIFALADQTPPVPDLSETQPLPPRWDISVRNLSFRYPDRPDAPVLDRVSFDLPEGKRLAIIGESGAGKTSLLNLLLRLWEPTGGAIYLGGVDPLKNKGVDTRSLDAGQVRSRFAVIAQRTTLFNATIRENLLLARPEATPEALYEAARRAQIHDFIQGLPQGYDTPVGERGMTLSAGERQRMAIARTLLQDAPILLLDEPTANLDAATAQAIRETLFREVFPGRSVIYITHDREEIADMRFEILDLSFRLDSLRGSQSSRIRRMAE